LAVLAGDGVQFDFIVNESANDARVESKSPVIIGLAGAAG